MDGNGEYCSRNISKFIKYIKTKTKQNKKQNKKQKTKKNTQNMFFYFSFETSEKVLKGLPL